MSCVGMASCHEPVDVCQAEPRAGVSPRFCVPTLPIGGGVGVGEHRQADVPV